jgi:hypothetical protein
MSSERAKFKYSAVDGVIELEGSEDFISMHMETLQDLVRVASRHSGSEKRTESKQAQATHHQSVTADEPVDEIQEPSPQGLEKYAKVFSEINEKLKIICKIEGKNKREKMINIALLYCFGSSLMGDEQVPSTEIRAACEEHGVLDGPNFAKIFDDKTVFLSDGKKGGTKQVKLTIPGTEKAELLAQELNK